MITKEHPSKYRCLTRQAWEAVLNTLHWSEEAMESPPSGYMAWMKKNSHSHEYSEVVVSLSGTHLYGIDRKAVWLSPGRAALVQRKVPHDAWYSEYHDECIDFWLHFLPHGTVPMNFVYHEPGKDPVFVPISCPKSALLDDLRRASFLLNHSLSVSNYRKARHFLAFLLHELFEHLMETDLGSHPVNEQSVIEEIKRYAIEHLTDRLTLTDMAKAAGYSPFYFHRMFLEAEGVTPRVFIEGQRLKRACDLLRKGHAITSVALDSGFATPSQFTRTFKKRFLTSPTEWIRTSK